MAFNKGKSGQKLSSTVQPVETTKIDAEFCFEHLRCLLCASALLADIIEYSKCQMAV